MEKVTLKVIAEKTNTTTTTVYNALNCSASVSIELKTTIIKTAKTLGYSFEENSKCDIAVLLPANPIYFWSEAKKGIDDVAKKLKLSVKTFLFSSLESEDDFLLCLDIAKGNSPKIYIIVPACGEGTIESIKNLDKPVIFLNEYKDIKGTYYVGSDSYEDGKKVSQICRNFLKENPRILIIDIENEHYMAAQRKLGFCDALPRESAIVGEIKIHNDKTAPSKLARVIREKYLDKFDCIYIAQGIIPQVSIALKKLNVTSPCIGFEKPVINHIYSNSINLKCKLVQQIRLQSSESIKYAVRILNNIEDRTRITIPSIIFHKNKSI